MSGEIKGVSAQTHIGCLVIRTVLGRSGKQFQGEVERLLKENGPEWVVSRFKAIWTAANHLRNGDKEAAVQLYREHSIAYDKRSAVPKGPVKPAVEAYVSARRPSVIRRYAAPLRFYASLQLSQLSKKQADKARKAILAPTSNAVKARAVSLADEAFSVLRSRLGKSPKLTIGKKPRLTALRASSYYYSREKVPKEVRGQPYMAMTMSLLTEGWVPPLLRDGVLGSNHERIVREWGDYPSRPIGKITALQEPGCKARVVAMPSARLQAAFQPLHEGLNKAIRTYYDGPSAMDDQTRAVYGVMHLMGNGKPAYSTDLSSATDRFPREFSCRVLELFGQPRYAVSLEEVTNRPFATPWGPKRYGAGQPMGLYGSFPLFHLSNLMVAEMAERRAEIARRKSGPERDPALTKFPNQRTFYVLGDDIVFSDERTMLHYREVMEDLEVDISESKSFSGDLTEFAGFIITRGKGGRPVAFRPLKPSVGKAVKNPIQFMSALGRPVRSVGRYWEKQFAIFERTTGRRGIDLTPLLSKEKEVGNNPFTGDASTLDNQAQVLYSLTRPGRLPELNPHYQYFGDIVKLPDGERYKALGSAPTFRERDRTSLHGYNPEKLAREDRESVNPHRQTSSSLRADPLMREEREAAESSSPTEDKGAVADPYGLAKLARSGGKRSLKDMASGRKSSAKKPVRPPDKGREQDDPEL